LGSREPAKISLDARDSKESNKLDKNIPLPLKFSRKIHICAFSVLFFWQFSEEKQNLVPRIPFTLSDPVFALRRRLKNPITLCAQKSWLGFGLFWGENYWGKKCRLDGLISRSCLGVLRTKYRG